MAKLHKRAVALGRNNINNNFNINANYNPDNNNRPARRMANSYSAGTSQS